MAFSGRVSEKPADGSSVGRRNSKSEFGNFVADDDCLKSYKLTSSSLEARKKFDAEAAENQKGMFLEMQEVGMSRR